jgi:hypothetical protein
MQNVMTTFSPQLNGLKFINRFEIPDFLKLNLPLFPNSPLHITDIVYGLCGGMCFTALDYFNVGKAVPAYTDINDISLGLFYYLWKRQLASLDHKVIEKLFVWMLLDDLGVARNVAADEVPALRAKLDKKTPVPLVLVRVRGISDPTHNHQVLAVGYDFDPDSQQMTIYLYDPNHPGINPEIYLNLKDPDHGIAISQSTAEPLRGFFLITSYRKTTPP